MYFHGPNLFDLTFYYPLLTEVESIISGNIYLLSELGLGSYTL